MAILTALAEVLAPQRCALLVVDVQRDFVHHPARFVGEVVPAATVLGVWSREA